MSQNSPYGPSTPTPPPEHAPAPGYYPVRPTNTMAILSLIFVFVFWPLAIVFGHIARKQISRTGESGRGLATAGLVLGYVFLAGTVIFVIAAVALGASAISNDPYSTMQSLQSLAVLGAAHR